MLDRAIRSPLYLIPIVRKMSDNKSSNKIKGNIFESYVENLYRGLGFKTKRNELVFGQEVDILAEKQYEGIGTIKILIECKYISAGKVSNQIVYDFLAFLKSLPDNLHVTRGVLVTTNGFSPEATLINDRMLSLVTQNELEREVLNLNSPFLILKKAYEAESIYEEYIPLNGGVLHFQHNSSTTTQNGHPNVREKAAPSRSSHTFNIEEDILQKIKNYSWSNWSFIAILGDYGSGKTTLMRRLFYHMINEALRQESNLKPIYLELKNFYKFQNVELFILNAFNQLFGKEISYELLQKEIKKGQIVFLFDGFDEMSPQISQDIRLRNFSTLAPLFASPSPCILSCRPSYFVSNEEYKEYLSLISKNDKTSFKFRSKKSLSAIKNTELVEKTYAKLFNKYFSDSEKEAPSKDGLTYFISEFNDDQINSYLEKFDDKFRSECSASWSEVKEFLSSIYDLSELMSKPLLLYIIKDTILLLKEEYKKKDAMDFGPAALYEIYTSINFDFDWKKGETRHFLTIEERRQFAEAIALTMFDKNILDVNYDDLRSLVTKEHILLDDLSKRLPEVSQENIISDIQICSFITRTTDDTFKFVHKSFMEFFVARSIKNKILDSRNVVQEERLLNINFPKEILYFLGSFAQVEGQFKSLLSRNINSKKGNVFRRNILTAYLNSSLQHVNLNIKAVILNEINLSKIEFINSEIENIKFEKNNWKGVSVVNSVMHNVTVSLSEIGNLCVNNVYGDIWVLSSKIRKSIVTSLKELKITLEDAVVQTSDFNNLIIQLGEKNLIEECQLLNCKVQVDGTRNFINSRFKICGIRVENGIELENCRFEKTSLSLHAEDSKMTLFNTTFESCEIEGAEIVYTDNLDTVFQDCSGYIFINAVKNSNRDILSFNTAFARSPIIKMENLILVDVLSYRHIHGDHTKWVKKIIRKRYQEMINAKVTD